MPKRAIKVPAHSISSTYATRVELMMSMERMCALATSNRLAGKFESDYLYKNAVGITCEAFDRGEKRLDELTKRVDHLHGRIDEIVALLKEHSLCPPDGPSTTSTSAASAPVEQPFAPPFKDLAEVIGKFDGNPLHLFSWTRKVDAIWYASKDGSYRAALLTALPKAMTGRAMVWLGKVGLAFRRNKPWPIWKLSIAAHLGGRIDRKEYDSGIVVPEFPESVKLIHADDDEDETQWQAGNSDEDSGDEVGVETLMRFFSGL